MDVSFADNERCEQHRQRADELYSLLFGQDPASSALVDHVRTAAGFLRERYGDAMPAYGYAHFERAAGAQPPDRVTLHALLLTVVRLEHEIAEHYLAAPTARRDTTLQFLSVTLPRLFDDMLAGRTMGIEDFVDKARALYAGEVVYACSVALAERQLLASA